MKRLIFFNVKHRALIDIFHRQGKSRNLKFKITNG